MGVSSRVKVQSSKFKVQSSEFTNPHEGQAFETEAIRRQGPWHHLEAVEYATLTWVDWFNTQRLLEPLGYVPPAEYEASYYAQAKVA